MSTANETDGSPAKTVPQSEDQLTAADFAAILSSTLAMAAEAGLTIGARATQTTPTRPAGLLVFISGLTIAADGRLVEEGTAS